MFLPTTFSNMIPSMFQTVLIKSLFELQRSQLGCVTKNTIIPTRRLDELGGDVESIRVSRILWSQLDSVDVRHALVL